MPTLTLATFFTIFLALETDFVAADAATATFRSRMGHILGALRSPTTTYDERYRTAAPCAEARDFCPAFPPNTVDPFISLNDVDFVHNYKERPPISSAASDAAIFAHNCAVTGMRATLRAHHEAAEGRTRWRYFATPLNMFSVWPTPVWGCGGPPYLASTRPYFNFALQPGTTALTIAIDVSLASADDTTARLLLSVAAARAVLRSLTPRDQVSVVLFDTALRGAGGGRVVPGLESGLVNATEANIAALVAELELLPQRALSTVGVDVSVGLQAAYAQLEMARDGTCVRAVALISSGFSTQQNTSVDALARANSQVPVFSLVADPGETAPVLVPATAACVSRGLLLRASQREQAERMVVAMRDALTTLHEPSEGRWTDWYEDAFGQGDVATAVLPVTEVSADDGLTRVRAMAAVDVPWAAVADIAGLTRAAASEVLAASERCPARRASTQLPRGLQGSACAFADQSVAGRQLTVTRLFGLWVVLSLVFAFGFTALMACGLDREADASPGAIAIVVAASMLFYLIALSVFWSMVWPDIIRKEYYEQTDYTVEAHEENPFRCCDLVRCACAERPSSFPSCSRLLSDLEEGECGNGYHCCRSETYECNCRRVESCSGSGSDRSCTTERRCSTCTRCLESVSNRACSVDCGTCFRPTVIVSYTFDEQVIFSEFSRRCGRDQVACKDDYLAQRPIGQRFTGFVNPESPKEILDDNSIRSPSLVAASFFAVLAFLINCAGVVPLLRKFWEQCRVPLPIPSFSAKTVAEAPSKGSESSSESEAELDDKDYTVKPRESWQEKRSRSSRRDEQPQEPVLPAFGVPLYHYTVSPHQYGDRQEISPL